MEVVEIGWADARGVALRAAMDVEMGARYEMDPAGETHPSLVVDPSTIVAVGLALDGDEPVGHAALRRRRDLGALEVKRVIVAAHARGRGVATALMAWLDERALALGQPHLVLHTGDRQPDAIALYEKLGWRPVPVFPPYDALPHSRCYARDL